MTNFLCNFAAENAVLPLDVATYRACKDKHGSKAAIAEINGFDAMIFSKRVDINNPHYPLHPEHIEAVVRYTKDIRIVYSIAAAHGGVGVYVIPDYPDVSDATFVNKIAKLSKKMSNLCQTLSNALEDGKICDMDYATIEKDVLAYIGVVIAFKKIAHARALQDAEQDQPFYSPESVRGTH